MANLAQVLVAPVTVLFVDTLRGMTPLDVDTAVGAVFAVCAVVVQIGLFALARAITKALSAGTKRAAAEKASPPPATPATPARAAPVTARVERELSVEAEVSGFAWMRAAGITPHDAASGDPGASPRRRGAAGARTICHRTRRARPAPLPRLFPSSRPDAHYLLTPAELQRLREFRALSRGGAEDPAPPHQRPQALRQRRVPVPYLRARAWNLKKALKMFSATARWRARTRPERSDGGTSRRRAPRGNSTWRGRTRRAGTCW